MFSIEEEDVFALTMPISLPFESNNPPPLLPLLILVSTRITLKVVVPPLSPSMVIYSESTLSVPVVAEKPSPSGLPMAIDC